MTTRHGSRSRNSTSEASLQEQVRLLTIENETLRMFIAEKGFTNALQAKLPNGKDGVRDQKTRRGSSSATSVKNKSPNFPTTPGTPRISGKGCSCKGNCSTKVCGCVKKNIPCAEFCRCGEELCQNSEPDKENIGDPNHQPQLSKDGEDSLRKLSKLTLTEHKVSKKNSAGLNPVKKNLEKIVKPRSIFSPDVPDDVFTFEDALGEVEFENLSLRFGEDIETVAGGSAEKDNKASGTKEATEKKSKKKNNKKTENTKAKNTGAAEKQNNRLDLIPTNDATDDLAEPELSNKTKKKVKRNEKTRVATKRNNRVNSEEKDDVAFQNNEHSESEPEPVNKNKKKAGTKATGATAKRNNQLDSEEKDDVASQDNEHSESDPELVNNKKKKAGTKITGAAAKRNNRMDSEKKDILKLKDNEHSESDPEPISKNKKKAGTKEMGTAGKRNNQINSQEKDNEHSEFDAEPVNKKEKKVGTKATGAAGKRNNRMDSEEKEDLASQKNEHSESNPVPANKNKKNAEMKATGATGKRNKRMDSEEKDDVSSQENEHSESDSESANKEKKKVEMKGRVTALPKKRNNRIYSEDLAETSHDHHSKSEPEPDNKNNMKVEMKGIAIVVPKERYNRIYFKDETSQDDNSESKPEPANKNEKNVTKIAMANGVAGKRNNRVLWTESDKEASLDSEHSESEAGSTSKSKKTVQTRGKTGKAERDQENLVEMGESSPKNGDYIESDARMKIKNDVIAEEKETKNHEKNTTEANNTFEESDLSELNPTGSKASSDLSVGTNNLLNPKAADDFNPMKPRRQLSRSPMGQRTEPQPQRIHDPSEILLPIPLNEESEDEVPPPEELSKVIVDWNEHLANLVKCSKCARTFHPHRIKKHENSCHKI